MSNKGTNTNSTIAISVEGISKSYKIGRLDPYAGLKRKARRVTNLIMGAKSSTDVVHDDSIWALRDISFKVYHGETIGIIGRNGAGKSTFLKILSRITAPTEGCIKVYGRIASLLEVGTGFHPDLTGRENIYLNASIIGMDRTEVRKRFDEIVEFAEVDQFIDTPVKHYSSGMYMRLAFSVSAHLSHEILVLDEVLAVGDAAFQQKCIGKMESEALRGRTVLFVSHDLGAVASLCSRAILLEKGRIVRDGPAKEVITAYQARSAVKFQPRSFSAEKIDISSSDNAISVDSLDEGARQNPTFKIKTDDPDIPDAERETMARGERFGNGKARFKSFSVTPIDANGTRSPIMRVGYDLEIEVEIYAVEKVVQASAAVSIFDRSGFQIIEVNTAKKNEYIDLQPGESITIRFTLSKVLLRPDQYRLSLWLGRFGIYNIDCIPMAMDLGVEMNADKFTYSIDFRGPYLIEFDHKLFRSQQSTTISSPSLTSEPGTRKQ